MRLCRSLFAAGHRTLGNGSTGGHSRLDDIVIHASPTSSRLRAKPPRRVPLPILDLSERTKTLLKASKAGLKRDERIDVIQELDRRGGDQAKQVSAIRYKQISEELSRSFLSHQLKDYLKYRSIKTVKKTKAALIDGVLEAWNVEVKASVRNDEIHSKVLPTTNRDLFFMLGQDGTMMRKWARQCNAQVTIDAWESTIEISATQNNVKRFEVRMSQALASVRSQTFSSDVLHIYKDEVHGPMVMGVIKAFIEKTADTTIRISWLGQRDDPYNDALRYIYASIVSDDQTSVPVHTARAQDVRQAAVVDTNLPLFERNRSWTRLVVDAVGAPLPDFVRQSTGTQSFFINQVPWQNHRHLFSLAQPLNSSSLEALMRGPGAVHFGFALESTDGRKTFGVNIPGLVNLIRKLTPATTPQTSHWSLFFRANPFTSILASAPDSALKPPQRIDESYLEIKIPTTGPEFSAILKRPPSECIVKLPDHATDLNISKTDSKHWTPLSGPDVSLCLTHIAHLLRTDRNPKLPPRVTIDGVTWWFERMQLESSLVFSVTSPTVSDTTIIPKDDDKRLDHEQRDGVREISTEIPIAPTDSRDSESGRSASDGASDSTQPQPQQQSVKTPGEKRQESGAIGRVEYRTIKGGALGGTSTRVSIYADDLALVAGEVVKYVNILGKYL